MKIRDVIFDLTAFLDVILVLLFLVMMMNMGELVDNRQQMYDADNQRILAEAEREAAEYALVDAQMRMRIFEDWDYYLDAMLHEINTLQDWRVSVEGSASFIFVEMFIVEAGRFIHVEAAPDIFRSAEVRWDTGGRNTIDNRDELLGQIHGILTDITDVTGLAHPVMVIFNPSIAGTAQQESQLISDAVHQFIHDVGDDVSIYYSVRTMR
ncbi:MAG: hypothetical protein FWC71_10020 [Defluviitaleaceae bacterium]|nr:hypothetical protein [Defluviitaleaceae bacterium]